MYNVLYIEPCTYIYVFHFKDTSPITDGMAVVTIHGLECEVTYNIIAGGILNKTLVGPRSSHGNISAGPCPILSSSSISPNTCKNSKYSLLCTYVYAIIAHTYVRMYACTYVRVCR